MRLKMLVLVFFLCVTAAGMPVTAAEQPLPASPWYAVVWNTDADTLHWVNAGGEQASIARPELPGEAADSIAAIQISRNGRYLLQAVTLETQVRALGIYDLQAGQFVQVHQAGLSEQIDLGRIHTSNLTSQRIAVGLATIDPANPAWRILVLDLASGSVVAQLTNADLNLYGLAAFRMPVVVYYDLDEAFGQEVVHFQLLPINAGGSPTYDSYAWNTATGTIAASPYNHSDLDVQYLSGEMALAVNDPAYAALEAPPMLGISYNALARGFDPNGMTTIWVDGTRHNYRPLWAAGGQWLLYWSEGEPFAPNWNVVLANSLPASNQRMPLGPNIQNVWGAPDGYLALTDEGALLFMNQFEVEAFAADFGVPVFQIPDQQNASVVYVSDTGAFALPVLGEPGGVVVAVPDNVVAPVTGCDGAPNLRLGVGMMGRVAFTNGQPLRVRTAPGGDVVTQIAEGTVFNVLGGPECQGGYAWWQIRMESGVEGWSAEGDGNGYFVEPYMPGAAVGNLAALPSPTPPPVIVVLPTATPTPQLQIAALPTATPTQGLIIAAPADICNLAPATRLAPQMQARTNTPGGTLALRFSPTDEVPSHQVPHNVVVSILGEARCREGYRIWPVAVTLNGQVVTGWVSEGTQQSYFLDPV